MIKESFLPLEGQHLLTELQELIDDAPSEYVRRILRAAISRIKHAEDELLGAIDTIRSAVHTLEPWIEER